MPADVIVVDLDRDQDHEFDVAVPSVVIGTTSGAFPWEAPCDLVLAPDDPAIDAVRATAAENGIAAVAFVQLLRATADYPVESGLVAESAVYSALQSGPEFARWRRANPPKRDPAMGEAVTLRRDDDVLHITLSRPDVRNALNTAMRDQLVEAFDLAALDDSIREVHLWGEGAGFCAGGDLDEFGTFPDPATAHVIRLQQSVGRRIAQMAERVTAHLHGACLGSGIELPAFAATVLAEANTVIALPELSLGLIPGAGGTVSLPRRIGRLRTARLGLTGERIDATTALEWGLVDAVR
jgi:hypothetical protein